jgi:hypothetical protein
MKPTRLGLVGGIIAAASFSALSLDAQQVEWKLKVVAAGAPIRLQPDPASPILSTVPAGTVLTSYEKEGDWFRIITAPDKDGVVSIGYVAFADVVVLKEKVKPEPDFWTDQAGAFRGIGISVRITGGFASKFKSGLERGVIGLLDRGSDVAASMGYHLYHRAAASYLKGYDLGVDVLYRLFPRLGLGIGLDYSGLNGRSVQVCGRNEYKMSSITSIHSVDAYALRLGLHYEIPLSGHLKIALCGGPSLMSINYRYSFGLPLPGDNYSEEYLIRADGRSFGAWGGASVGLALIERAELFLEARGRLARIGGLKGREQLITVAGYQRRASEAEGTLFLVEGGAYSKLAVSRDASAAGPGAREAVFDVSGFSFLIGLKFKI